MAINYNAGTNTLTLDGTNTYTLADILAADVGGGWGVVTNVGEMYLIMAHVVIGDGSNPTKLIDNNVGMQIGVTGTRKTFLTLVHSSFEMTGCLLIFFMTVQKYSYGTWKFSNCSVYEREDNSFALYMRGTQEYKRTEFDSSSWYQRVGESSYNRCLTTISEKVVYATTGIIDDWFINGELEVVWVAATLRNSEITGILRIKADNVHAILINTIFDENTLEITHDTSSLSEKYEFNVLVTDKNNNPLVATITLKDKYGTIKHTTDTGVNGKLASAWEVLANKYEGTSETKTEYNPFTLTVRKLGYADYETEITIDHEIESDQIVLGGLTYTYDNIMDEIAETRKRCRERRGIL